MKSNWCQENLMRLLIQLIQGKIDEEEAYREISRAFEVKDV